MSRDSRTQTVARMRERARKIVYKVGERSRAPSQRVWRVKLWVYSIQVRSRSCIEERGVFVSRMNRG
jgi:hypothetical protein